MQSLNYNIIHQAVELSVRLVYPLPIVHLNILIQYVFLTFSFAKKKNKRRTVTPSFLNA